MNNEFDWMNELPVAITVCDTAGNIIYMNNSSVKVFEKDGGIKLTGKNLFDCHPEQAVAKLSDLLKSKKTNIYTIEKNNIKKMIYQAPWYSDGKFMGLIELSFEIPFNVPHFIRKTNI